MDALPPEIFRLSLRAGLTTEFRHWIIYPIVVFRDDQAVTSRDHAAVRTPDLIPDLPLGRDIKRPGSEDKPIDPEEYEAAD